MMTSNRAPGGGVDRTNRNSSSRSMGSSSSTCSNIRGQTFVLLMIGCTLHVFGILLGFMLGSLNEQSSYIMKMEKDIATLVGHEETTDNTVPPVVPNATVRTEDEPGTGGGIRGGQPAALEPRSPNTASTAKSYGLSYLRCTEAVDSWTNQIPPDWNVTIWEKCTDQSADPALSVQLAPEEREFESIGAHLKYIVENYDDLPDVVVFSRQGELLRQRSKPEDAEDDDAICPPTPYYSLQEMQDDLDQHLQGYLALAALFPTSEKLYGEPYHGNFSLPSLAHMIPNNLINVSMFQEMTYIPAVHFIPGGTYAVTKERIRKVPIEQYKALAKEVTTPPDYELPRFIKKKSAAVDRLVHVLFGEPLLLPPQSYVRTFRKDLPGCPGKKNIGDRYTLDSKWEGAGLQIAESAEEQRNRRCGNRQDKLPEKVEGVSLAKAINGTVPKYGLSIVRCSEDSEWIKSVPQDWGVVVWEKCNAVFDQRVSVKARHGVGGEDLSAHMKYIIRHYNNLPEVSIFMQADALKGYEQVGRNCPHTPYCTLSELRNDLEKNLDGFYNIGSMGPTNEPLFNASYHGVHSQEVFEIVAPPDMDIPALLNDPNKAKIRFVLGSHFAVTKERILRHPIETYQKLYDFIFKDEPVDANARRRACTLERMLHILFGEPLVIPVDKYARGFRSQTKGCEI